MTMTEKTTHSKTCECPVDNGMIYHLQGICTDPVVKRLHLYAANAPGAETETEDKCHCTGAEAPECTENCVFAGGGEDDDG